MSAVFPRHRWSTLTLISVGVVLCACGYLAGRRHAAPSGMPVEPPRADARPAGTRPQIAAAELPAAVAPRREQDDHWRALSAGTRTAGTEKKMAVLIEEMAASDHLRALALAAAEPNWRLRTLLRNAALRGWASTAPADAAQFTLALPEHERREAVAALLYGASNHPEAAVSVAATLCAQDPGLAEDHGRALVEALSEVGAFATLARFAQSDPSGHGNDWLHATFYQWAEREPAAALAALDSLPTPAARQAAFQGLALGWSRADPRELAAYAVALPAGENRTLALQQALAQWMTQEPAAVSSWVMRFDPGPEFDLSAATVATTPAIVMQQPAVALGWAQSIIEPTLRESTLTLLAQQWAGRDRAAAVRLIQQTTGLSPADRSVLLAGLDSLPPKDH